MASLSPRAPSEPLPLATLWLAVAGAFVLSLLVAPLVFHHYDVVDCFLNWARASRGRQPWAIDGLLPTFLGVSATPRTNVLLSLTGFTIFYSALAAVDVFLLLRMIRRGPDGLGYWPTPPTVAVSH